MLCGKWAHTKPTMWRNVTNEGVATKQWRGTDFDEAVLMGNVCQDMPGVWARTCRGLINKCEEREDVAETVLMGNGCQATLTRLILNQLVTKQQPQHNPNTTSTQLKLGLTRLWVCTTTTKLYFLA